MLSKESDHCGESLSECRYMTDTGNQATLTQARQGGHLRKQAETFLCWILDMKDSVILANRAVQARTIMTSVCEQKTNTRQHNLHLILCVRCSLRCQQGYNTAAALTTEHCIVTRDTWHVTCCGGVTRARDPPHTIHLGGGNWNPY